MFFNYLNLVDYELFETRYEELQKLLNEEDSQNVKD